MYLNKTKKISNFDLFLSFKNDDFKNLQKMFQIFCVYALFVLSIKSLQKILEVYNLIDLKINHHRSEGSDVR